MNFVMIEDGFLSLTECNTLIKKYKNKTNKKSLSQHVSYAECDTTGEDKLNKKSIKLINKYRKMYTSLEMTAERWGMKSYFLNIFHQVTLLVIGIVNMI